MDKSPILEDSKTATAPMLATSEPAGSGMIPELVTADWGRHDERHCSHDEGIGRGIQALAHASAINFLRQPEVGPVRSLVEYGALSKIKLDIRAFSLDAFYLSDRALGFYTRIVVHTKGATIRANDDALCRIGNYKTRRSMRPVLDELIAEGLVKISGDIMSLPRANHILTSESKRDVWSVETMNEVLAMTGGRCFYCKTMLVVGTPCNEQFHIDHKTPLSRGGDNSLPNLAPSCRACNSEKRTMTADEYLAKRGVI